MLREETSLNRKQRGKGRDNGFDEKTTWILME
jgi:hypothetical protein